MPWDGGLQIMTVGTTYTSLVHIFHQFICIVHCSTVLSCSCSRLKPKMQCVSIRFPRMPRFWCDCCVPELSGLVKPLKSKNFKALFRADTRKEWVRSWPWRRSEGCSADTLVKSSHDPSCIPDETRNGHTSTSSATLTEKPTYCVYISLWLWGQRHVVWRLSCKSGTILVPGVEGHTTFDNLIALEADRKDSKGLINALPGIDPIMQVSALQGLLWRLLSPNN